MLLVNTVFKQVSKPATLLAKPLLSKTPFRGLKWNKDNTIEWWSRTASEPEYVIGKDTTTLPMDFDLRLWKENPIVPDPDEYISTKHRALLVVKSLLYWTAAYYGLKAGRRAFYSYENGDTNAMSARERPFDNLFEDKGGDPKFLEAIKAQQEEYLANSVTPQDKLPADAKYYNRHPVQQK